MRGEAAVADRRQEGFLVALRQLTHHVSELSRLAHLAEVEVVAVHITLEDLAADGDAAGALLVANPVADLLLGAAGLDEVQPVLARRLARRGDDLDGVAAAQ